MQLALIILLFEVPSMSIDEDNSPDFQDDHDEFIEEAFGEDTFDEFGEEFEPDDPVEEFFSEEDYEDVDYEDELDD